MRASIALAVIGLALAGCTTPAAQVSTDASGARVEATATGTEAVGPPLAPFALYLTPDLALSEEPASAGTVTLSTPVNGPFTPGYPAWNGKLPAAVNLTEAGVGVTLYLQTNSASVRANQVPLFADLPGLFLQLEVGNKTLHAEPEGPATMHAGHVYELNATLVGDRGWVEAGAGVTLSTGVIYTHIAGAAEFQFVMGPDQPARLGFA